jgi:uncharacterized protein (DUF58 family)
MPDDLANLLAQVRRIELRTERLVSSLAAGSYRSAFKGSGLEFAEVRAYADGDDARLIDWNVTARAGAPWVKVFREERELAVTLVVDASGSMSFGALPGTSRRAKRVLAAEAAAVVAVVASRNHDRLGLVRGAAAPDLHLPLRRGRSHCLRVVREVLAGTSVGRGDLAALLDGAARSSRRRGVLFLVSDFLHDEAGHRAFADVLARSARRHDVVGLRVTDAAEATLPAHGPLVIDDPEGSGQVVLSASAANRTAYAAAWQAARARTTTAFRAAGCDLVELDTAHGAFTALDRFLRQRRRKRG